MKQVVILFFAMQIACGSSDDSSSAPPPDVTRVNTTSGYCVTTCSVNVSAVYSAGGSIAPSGYSLVVATAEGVDPPAVCDASSKNGGMTYASIENLKPSTVYAFRACLFNNTAGTYSAGGYVVYTTPASR